MMRYNNHDWKSRDLWSRLPKWAQYTAGYLAMTLMWGIVAYLIGIAIIGG